jgi:hypothetical protein
MLTPKSSQRCSTGSGAAGSGSRKHQGDAGIHEEVVAKPQVTGDMLSARRCSHG